MGLREEKKRRTRKAIAELATQLFVKRGYDAVTTAEIAERAQVSVPTLFNYFPTKEALVFDEDGETETRLVKAVRQRKSGQTILEALLESGLAELVAIRGNQAKTFTKLVEATPALGRHARQMWLQHEQALGAAIRKEATPRMTNLEAQAVARFVLDSYSRALCAARPKATLRALFKILETGWRG